MYSNDNCGSPDFSDETRSKQKHLLPSRYAALVMWMMCKLLSAIQEVLIAYVPRPDAEAPNASMEIEDMNSHM